MLVRIGMAPRLAGLTPQQTLDHWQTSHAIAARKIPNLLTYIQNHAILDGGAYVLPYPGFDVCSELEFESVEAMDEGMNSPVYRQEVRADEDEFIQKPLFSLVLGRRHSAMAGWSPASGAKRMWFLRAHPARTVDALFDAAMGPMFKVVSGARLSRYDVIVADTEAHEGHDPAAFDVVVEAWFADPALAQSFVSSPAQAQADHAIAGLFSGRADWLCVPYRVK